MINIEPYTMPPKQAAAYFGFHEKTIYAMVESRELGIGRHYLKVGKKVLIIVNGFKQYLHEKSGVVYGDNQE